MAGQQVQLLSPHFPRSEGKLPLQGSPSAVRGRGGCDPGPGEPGAAWSGTEQQCSVSSAAGKAAASLQAVCALPAGEHTRWGCAGAKGGPGPGCGIQVPPAQSGPEPRRAEGRDSRAVQNNSLNSWYVNFKLDAKAEINLC